MDNGIILNNLNRNTMDVNLYPKHGLSLMTALLLLVTLANAQYCTPPYSFSCSSDDFIDGFETTGGTTNIANLSSGCNGINGGFVSGQSLTASIGSTVGFTITNNPDYTEGYKIWVDWNQDQDFLDAGELVYNPAATLGAGLTATSTFTVPISATVGTTRIRVRAVYNTTTFTSCSSQSFGEYEDYDFTVLAGAPCAGIPSAGTVGSSAAAVCSGQLFTLQGTGFTSALGISYQWYSAITNSGGVYSPIPGATNTSFTVLNQTSEASYYLEVSCNNPGGGVVQSNIVTVSQNPTAACYCASNLGGATGNSIETVSIPGTSLNNSSPGTASGFYTAYPGTGSTTADLQQGSTYTLNATFGAASIASLWIDYDQNGVFDATEWVQLSTNAASVSTAFTVPLGAMIGQTGMRIRTRGVGNTNGATDACTSFGSGETEDYIVNIIAASACVGTPVAGTITASATTVCTGQPITLSATGYTIGQGITFQWYASANGGAAGPITGATNPTYMVPGQSVETDYYLEVTCTNPGGGTSITQSVTVGQNTFVSCYCTTNLGGGNGNSIENITILGTTLNNASPGTTIGYYTAYPASGTTTADLFQGSSYTIAASFGAASIASLWIDYDQSGTFDALEWIQLTTNAATASVSITVPLNAIPGQTGMRVRTRGVGNVNGATDACSNFGSGETEDYIVTIVPAANCSGAPVAGTASSSVSSACTGNPFTLSTTGYTIGSGIVFQWQADNGGGFTNISGATDPQYLVSTQSTTTTYRLIISCTSPGGSNDTSNSVLVTQIPPIACYCIPAYTNTPSGCADDDNIDDFTLTGANGTTISDLATGCSANAYDDRTNQPAVDLMQGMTYNGTISSTYGSNEYVTMWVDFGNDGVFDNTDTIASISSVTSTGIPYSITIPAAAAIGVHRMRVRLVYNATPASSISPCAPYTYGETHDYLVNIIGNPLAITLGDVSATNVGNRNRVDWNSMQEDAGDKYEVERSANGHDFSLAGRVNGKGTAAVYTFMDESPVAGINYYRLRLMHGNGQNTYSKVVAATVRGAGGFTVLAYPNPLVGNEVNVEVRGTLGADATISITDMTGKLVARQAVSGNRTTLNLDNLVTGIYLIKYQDALHHETIKVTRQ